MSVAVGHATYTVNMVCFRRLFRVEAGQTQIRIHSREET